MSLSATLPVLRAPAAEVRVHHRVRARPTSPIPPIARYHTGTYSHTVDRVVFTDGTWARTDLIRLNPGVSAYSLDFRGIAPSQPSRYAVDSWSSVPHLRTRAKEAAVAWILRNSVPLHSVADLSRRMRAAGSPLGVADVAEHEAIAATQAAIWRLTNDLELDTRPLSTPTSLEWTSEGVVAAFPRAPQVAAYTVDLLGAGPAVVSLQKSADGLHWQDVRSSRHTVGAAAGTHAKTLGVGATLRNSSHGRAGSGYPFYRVQVHGEAAVAAVRFQLAESGCYPNADRIVHVYNYLLAGAQHALHAPAAPTLDADTARVAGPLVGPFRLRAADAATVSSEDAVVVDSSGAPITGPVKAGDLLYLRGPVRGRRAHLTVSVPASGHGYGGRVLTGVAGRNGSRLSTPLALALPVDVTVDLEVDWS